MGALSHYIEDEGVATVHISLVREHTERISPPRALWVPFELGRPLGAPNEPEFQRAVLRQALSLLTEENGPILAEFPQDAPPSGADAGPVVCPVSFPAAEPAPSDDQRLADAFIQEMARLRNWYDRAVAGRGRTTAMASGLTPDQAARRLIDAVCGRAAAELLTDMVPATALRTAVDDVKAYYLEAVSAQPGQPTDSASLNDWFWGQTMAAKMIDRLKTVCLSSDDPQMIMLAKLLLVPRTQAHRFEKGAH